MGAPRLMLFIQSENVQPFTPRRAVTVSIFNFNDAVEAVAYDSQNSRLVFASHSGRLKMYKIDQGRSPTASTPTFQEIWSKETGDAIPRAVFFIGGAYRNLLTLSLETAEMHVSLALLLFCNSLSLAIGAAWMHRTVKLCGQRDCPGECVSPFCSVTTYGSKHLKFLQWKCYSISRRAAPPRR